VSIELLRARITDEAPILARDEESPLGRGYPLKIGGESSFNADILSPDSADTARSRLPSFEGAQGMVRMLKPRYGLGV